MPEHLYRRGKIWHGWFYDELGAQVRRSTHCTDRRAAEAVVRGWERRAADPASVPANSTTIEDALKTLLVERRAKGRSEETVTMYRKKGGHLARLLGASNPIDRIDARAIDGYVDTRLAEGAARTTVGKELTTIRSMLKVARRRGEYSRDVAAVMPDGFRLEYKPRTTYLTAEQLDRVLAKLSADRAAHVAWIVATAGRWGESLRARRDDIDLHAKTVRVRGSKTDGADATIPIVGRAGPLLDLALEQGHTGKATLFRRWTNVRRDLHAACDAAKVPRVSPNDLRRTMATWLRQAGVEPHLIGAMLRHTDSRMVERVYGRMPAESLGAALDARLGRDAGVIGRGGRGRSQRQERKRGARKIG